jgi:AcrR family transcriptional regulator
VKAAGHEFLAQGYDSSSFRAIARSAGVDPALVHHYFPEKADLFAEAVSVPVRPDRILAAVLRGPKDQVGENLIRAILTTLDDRKVRDRMIGLIRTALGHEFAAAMVRQFFVREVLNRITAEFGDDHDELRATLVATHVVGLIMVRYGLRVEPLASAPIEELVRRIGPIIQGHLVNRPQPPLDGRPDEEE